MDGLTLAELLCARLCHDLSGPVGAAAAGAELLEETEPSPDAETVALVAASAASAAARLRFLRAALGPAASQPQAATGVRALIAAHLAAAGSAAAPAIVLDWQKVPPTLDGQTIRLLLNLVLLAKDALPRGGRITVTVADGAPVVTAEGDAARPAEEARAVLADGAPPAGPRGAQAHLARLLAETLGYRLDLVPTSAGLAFTPRHRLGAAQ